jgi:hypothetical protein
MERGELSDDMDNDKNRNFALINSTHESEEIIEEKLSRNSIKSPNNKRNTTIDEEKNASKKSRNKVTDILKSKSLVELKKIDNSQPLSPSPSERPSSTRSFRSRVSPTPEGHDENVAQPSSTRCNKSLTLPPLTIIHKVQENKPQKDSNDVIHNGTQQGSREIVRVDKHDDIFYRQENGKPKRTRMHQNGDVSYG